jgi:hypothetical protein
MKDRGEIRNQKYYSQKLGFAGLRYGNITPTDVDVMIEYRDKCFVWIELKYQDHPVPLGQRLALERLCDAVQAGRKDALLLVATHHAKDKIDVAEAMVIEYRWMGLKRVPKRQFTVKKALDKYMRWHGWDGIEMAEEEKDTSVSDLRDRLNRLKKSGRFGQNI